MPRRSVKEEKNIYFQSREAAGLTREEASEKTEFLSEDRIERIESERSAPHPDEVLAMTKAYGDPLLVNRFCSGECPIGKKYVPEVTEDGLSAIVLNIIDSVNGLSANKDRLIGITADGVISEEERADFEKILGYLDRVSSAAGTMKLLLEKWME